MCRSAIGAVAAINVRTACAWCVRQRCGCGALGEVCLHLVFWKPIQNRKKWKPFKTVSPRYSTEPIQNQLSTETTGSNLWEESLHHCHTLVHHPEIRRASRRFLCSDYTTWQCHVPLALPPPPRDSRLCPLLLLILHWQLPSR